MARYVQGFEEFRGGRCAILPYAGNRMADMDATKDEPTGGEAAEGEALLDEEGSGGGKKKKILIAVGGVVLLLLLGGAGAYFSGALDAFLPGHKPDCTDVEEGHKDFAACEEMKAVEAAAQGPGFFIDVPDLIVNLNSATSKKTHFLKISLKIELEHMEDEAPFNEAMPRVIDQFQTYLRELRMEDLRGSSGLYRMKIELLTRVRAAAPGIGVRDVLFQEILVQ